MSNASNMSEVLSQAQTRIDELEMRVAFQEDALSELNDVIARQDDELLKMREQVRALAEKHRELSFRMNEGEGPSDERPPHY